MRIPALRADPHQSPFFRLARPQSDPPARNVFSVRRPSGVRVDSALAESCRRAFEWPFFPSLTGGSSCAVRGRLRLLVLQSGRGKRSSSYGDLHTSRTETKKILIDVS